MFQNIPDLLKWLVYSGGAVIVASWLLERWPWFQARTPQIKKAISVGASVVIALACFAVLTYVPAGVWDKVLDPWFRVASAVILTTAGGQAYHKLTKPS